MTAAQNALAGYGQSASTVRSHRSVEYQVISKISHRLRKTALTRHEDFPSFVSALSDNRNLWTALAIDVAQRENALPENLRAQIFWLSEFTEQESRKILRGSGDVSVLIEINAAIMRGLRGEDSLS